MLRLERKMYLIRTIQCRKVSFSPYIVSKQFENMPLSVLLKVYLGSAKWDVQSSIQGSITSSPRGGFPGGERVRSPGSAHGVKSF